MPVLVLKKTFLSRRPAASARWAAVLTLAVASAFSVVFWENWKGLAESLPASKDRVFVFHEYWRLFTALAAHSDADHLIANALPLSLLSYLLFGYFGIWVHPFATVCLGALTNAISVWTYDPKVTLVGASGMVYLMAAFWLVLYVFVDRRYSVAKRLLRGTGAGLALLIPSTIQPQVSYRTHAIGFAIGLVYGFCYAYARRQSLRAAERFEIEESEEDLPPFSYH